LVKETLEMISDLRVVHFNLPENSTKTSFLATFYRLSLDVMLLKDIVLGRIPLALNKSIFLLVWTPAMKAILL
jgi:hypothetical protein